ncbi:MAG: hypothetical protein ACM30G_07300, partial [Micromonosporaceae bacterium]
CPPSRLDPGREPVVGRPRRGGGGRLHGGRPGVAGRGADGGSVRGTVGDVGGALRAGGAE